MSDQEILYSILDKISEVKSDIAVIQSQQAEHIKKQDKLVESHYKLKGDFNAHKNKFLLITGSIGSLFGIISTWLYNYFKNT